MNYLYVLAVFNAITFVAALSAIRFWAGMYEKAKRGSIAWLLFVVVSVYMLSEALFPYVIFLTPLNEYSKYSITIRYLTFWSAVYTSFFAGAGMILYRNLVTYPREELSKILVYGLAKPEKIKKNENVEIPEFISEFFRGKSIIRYNAREIYENAIIELCFRFWGELRNVIVITSIPKAKLLGEKLSDLIEIGAVKLVGVGSRLTEIKNGRIVEFSADYLPSLPRALDSLPSSCVVIIDLTPLLLYGVETKTIKALFSLPHDTIFLSERSLKVEGKFENTGRINRRGIEIDGKKVGYGIGKKFYIQQFVS